MPARALAPGCDLDLAAAQATRLIEDEGGAAAGAGLRRDAGGGGRGLVEACLARFGRIDILVNNVGRSEPGDPVTMDEETGTSRWTSTSRAPSSCKQVLPVMERQGGGSIVNVSSIAGLRYVGKPQVAYARPRPR